MGTQHENLVCNIIVIFPGLNVLYIRKFSANNEKWNNYNRQGLVLRFVPRHG